MIKGLKKESATELYHYKNGEKVLGKNKLMLGNCTGLSGDCTGLWGDLDLCEITDSDRKSKIKIKDLIQ